MAKTANRIFTLLVGGLLCIISGIVLHIRIIKHESNY